MIALPMLLFAAGVVLVIVGAISTALFGSNRSSDEWIDPRMRDRDIAKLLEKQQPSVGFSGFIIYLGVACVLVSAVWRLLRPFVRF